MKHLLRFDKRRDMAGVAVPSLTVNSQMAVRLAGVELELVPAPGETEVQCSPIVASMYIDIHKCTVRKCQFKIDV